MITFDDALDTAMACVRKWNQNAAVAEVTLIRDVYGKVTLLINNTISMDDSGKNSLISILNSDMGAYFSGRVYWKKLSNSQKKMEEREKVIIDLIECERIFWKEDGNIPYYLSERAIAKKAWIYRWKKAEAVWPYEEAINGTKVITFYSFKGGMGRTTALAGIALSLVRQGKNVMMVDTDIEAPGLATLFLDEEAITKGVLDYLIEHEINPGIHLADFVCDIAEPSLLEEDEGRLFLMAAGKVDENYLQKLARIDYQDNRDGYLRDAMKELLLAIRNNYDVDYILVDARAGFHDMGGIAVTQIPHGVVLFGNDSRQSWDGITQVLRTIAEGHEEDFPVMIVNTMCPKPTANDFASSRQRFISKAHTVCVENYYEESSKIPGIEAEGEVHFPELIPFHDELLRGIELYSDESPEKRQRVSAYKSILIGESYRKIAERIDKWFGVE